MVWKHRLYLLIFFFHELEIRNIWGAAGCAEKCTSKQRKMVASFCEELLSENDFEAVLVNFCCYDYGANASEAVQKISTRTLLELCQLTKSPNFIATPIKNICSSY